jgi:type 1 fimbria pilin
MNRVNLSAGLVLITAMMMFSGCYKPWNRIEGNMDVETETRQLPPFSKVYNEGDFEVYIIQDGASEVVIEAESNLIPFIRTRIQGSALEIDTKDDLRNNFPMKIFVHTGEIKQIRLSGSGLIEASDILADDMEVDLSGSGDIYFSGNCDDVDCDLSGSGSIEFDNLNCNILEIDISGSGDVEADGTADIGDFGISGSGSIRAYDLSLQECEAKISGSGNIYVNAEDKLSVNISGSGNVYYLGNPVLNIKITGSGSVIHP